MIELLFELILIDPWLWKKYKTDKPLSTAIWFILVCIVGILVEHVIGFNWLLSYIALSMAIRFSLFDYIYNLVFGKPWDYLGLDYWNRKKNSWGKWIRIPVEVFVLLVGVMQFLYFACLIYNDSGTTITFNLPRFCT